MGHQDVTISGSTIVDGRNVSASNTGIAGIGVNHTSLTSTGSTAYGSGFNGQTITGKLFTGEVTVTGSNITLSGCAFAWGGAVGNGTDIALEVSGSNCTIEDCTFDPTNFGANPSNALYIACLISGGSGNTVQRCDIGRTENGITMDSGTITNPLIQWNYIHDLVGNDNDCIEVYGAVSGLQVLNNWLTQSPAPGNVSNGGAESSFNIAPYASGHSVANTLVQGNFMDGGIVSVVVDNQSTGTITFTKFVGNFDGGHQNAVVGQYTALQNNDGRAITHDDTAQASDPNSIQWPNAGVNANHWYACTGLTPDNSGQIIDEG